MIWAIQTNLSRQASAPSDVQRLMQAVVASGDSLLQTSHVPFSDELPGNLLAVPNDVPLIAYGATNFVNQVFKANRWKPGVWYDSQTFRYQSYLKYWGPQMLNSEAELTTMGSLGGMKFDEDKVLFIRPDKDLKEFAGETIRFGDFKDWTARISHGGYTISPDTEVIYRRSAARKPRPPSPTRRLALVVGDESPPVL